MALHYKSETERSINNRYNNIINDIRAISDIKFGEYWNTTSKKPQRANILTSLSRTIWYTKESRGITLTHIDMLIDASICLLDDIHARFTQENNNEYVHIARDLRIDIMNMQQGILSLKGVYYDDEKIKSSIDDRVARIKIELQNLAEKYANI
jgi:hypothetical protein